MKPLANDSLIRALLRQPVDRTPVWMMRQAGRYLPEYRRVREQAGNFMKLCTTPELACEVTLQPIERYRLDAAILFSDILTIPHAMGLGLEFVDGEGPRFHKPVRSAADIRRLPVPDPESELRYVPETVRLIQRALQRKVPLIGFSGSPWTLATYMVEGGGSREFRKIKQFLYEQPQLLHQLLSKLTDAVVVYLNAQIAAGVDTVMLFDTWGGVLGAAEYEQFSLHYASLIAEKLNTRSNGSKIPSILFTKGGGQWLEAMSRSGYDALGLDWTTHLGCARLRVGNETALQGNLDPIILFASRETIRAQVQHVLQQFGTGTGHVFNLGHGVLPDVDPAHVEAMIEAVHELSPAYHENSRIGERTA
jgi:uroporphyrinogen decarboxylase